MKQSSPEVSSRQATVHPRLKETVLKHAAAPWRKPVADRSRRDFEGLATQVMGIGRPLILDTGCGTGMSTEALAARFPDRLVIGVDKSEFRLEKHRSEGRENALLVRFDLEDFWLLAHEVGWQFERQYFFYPNPWPKPEHRLRRWPFHPVFPMALACGGLWELRTNWAIYAEEFAMAYGLLTGLEASPEPWCPTDPETLFEKKYGESGHQLWRWISPGAGTGQRTRASLP